MKSKSYYEMPVVGPAASKTLIAGAAKKSVEYINDLIATLPSESKMDSLETSDAANSGRVKEESRNVRVKACLYAASREKDTFRKDGSGGAEARPGLTDEAST